MRSGKRWYGASVRYGAERRTVLTVDGLILPGDSDHRPGDPVIGPDGKVHDIVHVFARKEVGKPTCEQARLW